MNEDDDNHGFANLAVLGGGIITVGLLSAVAVALDEYEESNRIRTEIELASRVIASTLVSGWSKRAGAGAGTDAISSNACEMKIAANNYYEILRKFDSSADYVHVSCTQSSMRDYETTVVKKLLFLTTRNNRNALVSHSNTTLSDYLWPTDYVCGHIVSS